jgi:hypothetical protein
MSLSWLRTLRTLFVLKPSGVEKLVADVAELQERVGLAETILAAEFGLTAGADEPPAELVFATETTTAGWKTVPVRVGGVEAIITVAPSGGDAAAMWAAAQARVAEGGWPVMTP